MSKIEKDRGRVDLEVVVNDNLSSPVLGRHSNNTVLGPVSNRYPKYFSIPELYPDLEYGNGCHHFF